MADSTTKQAVHPKYNEMVATAIETLKEKRGSSRAAIIKFITGKYKVSDNPNVVNSKVKLTLKKGVESGVLTQVKGTGAIGSFKLSKKPQTADKPKKTSKKPVGKPKNSEKKPAKKVTSKSPKKAKAMKAAKSPKKIMKSIKKNKDAKSPSKTSKPKPKAPKSTKKIVKSDQKAAKPKPKKITAQKSDKKVTKPKVKK